LISTYDRTRHKCSFGSDVAEQESCVAAWLSKQAPSELSITVITLHEINFGIERLAPGPQRLGLVNRFDELMRSKVGGPILVLDPAGARRASLCRAAAIKAIGHCDVPESLIAGIALINGASVATHNVDDFKHFGVTLIDPWATFKV
jgi:toxin FitB